MVEVSGSKDNFKVFNQFQSLKVPSSDFGDLPLAKASHAKEALSRDIEPLKGAKAAKTAHTRATSEGPIMERGCDH